MADINFRLVVDAVPCSAETEADFKRVQVSLRMSCCVTKRRASFLRKALLMLGCLLQDLMQTA